MSNTKISSLASATTANPSDIIPIVQSGVTKQASLAQLLAPGAATVSVPTALGWDSVNYGFTATLQDIPGTVRSVARVSVTAETIFNAKSTALTAPGATFWVDTSTGIDTNAGTQAAPFKTFGKALNAANTAAVPTLIMVKAGVYDRTTDYPVIAVDVAFVAYGGRVQAGCFNNVGTPSRDATYTNCYSYSLSSVNRVVDLANLNEHGNYTELVNVSTAALCNTTSNSWANVSGTIYINRRDQAAVVTANTRVYRAAVRTITSSTDLSLYMAGQTAADGFDFEGGSGGVLQSYIASGTGVEKAIVARNCTFKYGGGVTDQAANGVSMDGVKGIVYFENCRADANVKDAYNYHNGRGASKCLLMTVNCTGFDNGRYGQSCNGWTTHETVVGIDLAGYYLKNRGGTVRSIGTTKSWLCGTAVENDLGDLALGGVTLPTAFQVDDTAQYWCERTKVLQAATAFAYVITGTGSIHRRNVAPTPLPDYGPTGTFDTF